MQGGEAELSRIGLHSVRELFNVKRGVILVLYFTAAAVALLCIPFP